MANETALDPRFCTNLMVNNGWVTNLDLQCKDGISPPRRCWWTTTDYQVDVEHDTTRSTKLVNVRKFRKKSKRGAKKPPHTYHTQQVKGKGLAIDHDGFQHVRNRRGIRRNIFNEVDDEPRKHAMEQREATKKSKRCSHLWNQNVNEEPEDRQETQQGQGKLSDSASTPKVGSGIAAITIQANRERNAETLESQM